jgi:uncharacterized protein (TIGR02246 family)
MSVSYASTASILPGAEQAVRNVLEQQANAWNAGDAKLYADTFMQDATCTNVLGDVYSGQKALSARMAEILRTVFKGSTLRLAVRRLRFIRADIAVADIDAGVRGYQALPPGIAANDGVLRTAMLQVLVHEDQQWRVAAFHNVDVKKPSSAVTSRQSGSEDQKSNSRSSTLNTSGTSMPAGREEAIRAILDQQTNAWNEGDARRFLEALTDDASFTPVIGETFCGKYPLLNQLAELLRTAFRGSTLQFNLQNLQFIRPDVAVLNIDSELRDYKGLPPGVSATDGVLRTALLQVMAHEDGQWRVVALHNVDRKKLRQ